MTLKLWLGGALGAFIDGFIDGCPIGAPAGAALAASDGQVFADFGTRHLLIEAAHVLAVPFFSGLADVRGFHKDNPFPNIFAPAAAAPAPPPPAPPAPAA